jgi:NADPH:quinone reductase-like Zn-dependent oxidoreductase
MKAIVQDAYGSPDALELRAIEKPEIVDDEVLVRVHAAGLSTLARRLSVTYPIVLDVGPFGFVPGPPEVNLVPEVVLVIRSI